MTAVALEMLPDPFGVYRDADEAAPMNIAIAEELQRHVSGLLGPGERHVLLVIARRLLAGQQAYGLLAIAGDRRDWRKERAEELADALVYGAIAEIAAAIPKDAP